MDASQILQILLGIIGFFLVKTASEISEDLKLMRKSVEQLNITMATHHERHERLRERVDGHDEILKDLANQGH